MGRSTVVSAVCIEERNAPAAASSSPARGGRMADQAQSLRSGVHCLDDPEILFRDLLFRNLAAVRRAGSLAVGAPNGVGAGPSRGGPGGDQVARVAPHRWKIRDSST